MTTGELILGCVFGLLVLAIQVETLGRLWRGRK